jgi:hypothetical protein
MQARYVFCAEYKSHCLWKSIPTVAWVNCAVQSGKYVGYDAYRRLSPITVRSKALVCSRLIANVAGSNPTGGMDVRLLCLLCVV